MTNKINKAQVLQSFGRHLKEKRAKLTCTSQERMAALLQMDRSYIGGIEQGRRNPSLISLVRIANGLGISLAELFEGFEA